MSQHQVHYFSDENGETEFVVISDQAAESIKEEYANEELGLRLVESLVIDGDASSLPCDRKLFK